MNFKTLSILSLSILMLQGCGSMSTRSGDGAVNVFKYMSFQEPGTAPWDPPIEVGYGGRIPNMQGDWDRHCSGISTASMRGVISQQHHYINTMSTAYVMNAHHYGRRGVATSRLMRAPIKNC